MAITSPWLCNCSIFALLDNLACCHNIYHSLIGQKRIDPLWQINLLINQIKMQSVWLYKQITKKLKYIVENKWHGDLFTNGENLTVKTSSGDFQVTTLETPLLSQQAATSKGIPNTLSTYSWTPTPIPNWTCSVVTVPLLMHGSQVRD